MKRDILISIILTLSMSLFFGIVTMDVLYGNIALEEYSSLFKLRCGWEEFIFSLVLTVASFVLYTQLCKNYINFNETNNEDHEI